MADQGAYSIQATFLNDTNVVLTITSASKERGSDWLGDPPKAGQTIGPGESRTWGSYTSGTVAAIEVDFSGLPPIGGQPFNLFGTNSQGFSSCYGPKGPTSTSVSKETAGGAHSAFAVTLSSTLKSG